MDGKSEVLLRSRAQFGGNVLLAGLPADELLAQLPEAFGWSWQMEDFAVLSRRFGARCHFGAQPPEGEFAAAVLFLPKSREQVDWLLAMLGKSLLGKPLYLVGEKRAGIERAAKQLQAFGRARKQDSARHCQLWQVTVERALRSPQLAHWMQHYSVPFDAEKLAIVSLPGVFAHGRLDEGTALLLEHLQGLPRGALLDFGCGAGIIGAALSRRYLGQAVLLADSSAFALQSSRLTLAASDVQGEVLAVCGIADAPKNLAAIVSNPPFHQGVATHYQVTQDLLREAVNHLKAGGELRIVANSFLSYPALLQQHFGNCEVLAQRGGFQVLRAVKR